MTILRWGIVGAGSMSHDFVNSIKSLELEGHEVVVIASRELSRAKRFAKIHEMPHYVEGYTALAQRSDINIVYIGVINTKHYNVGMLMLGYDKHILCEKPLTTSKALTKVMLQFARKKNLFAMEAVWSRFFPLYSELKSVIDLGIVGHVQTVYIECGHLLTKPRVLRPELGGSIIFENGLFALQLVQFMFKGRPIKKFLTEGALTIDKVDISANLSIHYFGGIVVHIHVTAIKEAANKLVIKGTEGTIIVPQFWRPTRLFVSSDTGTAVQRLFPLPTVKIEKFNTCKLGLSYEAEECRKCIMLGMIESPKMSHEDSIGLMELVERWRAQLGALEMQ